MSKSYKSTRQGYKKYLEIETDIQCEVKTSKDPFDRSDDMHNHRCHEVLIVLRGNLHLYTEYSGREIGAGDIAFIPHYLFHRAELQDMSCYDRIVINMTDDILKSASGAHMNLCACFEPYNDMHLHTIHMSKEALDEIKKYSVELQKNIEHPAPGSDILADSYLKLIMVLITSEYLKDPIMYYPNIMPPLVQNTFDYIDKHLTEDISLSTLEEVLHHNGTYISRCVKRISGLSIQQYIIAKRVAYACRLLRDGYSATEACFMSGFNNYSNFSRTFSKQVGKSPRQLQQNARTRIS